MQSNAEVLGSGLIYLHLFMQKLDVLDRFEQHRCCISLKKDEIIYMKWLD